MSTADYQNAARQWDERKTQVLLLTAKVWDFFKEVTITRISAGTPQTITLFMGNMHNSDFQ